jgi:hypothetical protein
MAIFSMGLDQEPSTSYKAEGEKISLFSFAKVYILFVSAV